MSSFNFYPKSQNLTYTHATFYRTPMPRKTATPKIMTNWPPKAYRDNRQHHAFVPTLNDRTYFAVRECIDKKLFSLQEIADKSSVKKGWLRMYALGRIPDPSVSRIERLYFFLTSNRL